MNKLNILVAYPYMSNDVISFIKENQDCLRFVLDSGAFTAWKAGKPIALDDYCRFLDSLPFKPWRYFTLDVVGKPDETLKNYSTMLSRGFTPVPIFTRGEHPSLIDEYYKSSDVVGIGGLVGTPKNKNFVKGIMSHIKDRRVHWLGFTNQSFILHYKPYMCDSSSFDSGVRFGHIPLYRGAGQFYKISKKDMVKPPSKAVINLVEQYGEDWEKLRLKSEWVNSGTDKTAMERLIYKSAIKYNSEISKKTGSKFFFACTTKPKVRSLLKFREYGE